VALLTESQSTRAKFVKFLAELNPGTDLTHHLRCIHHWEHSKAKYDTRTFQSTKQVQT